jgi:hypothetical protein
LIPPDLEINIRLKNAANNNFSHSKNVTDGIFYTGEGASNGIVHSLGNVLT